MFFTCERTPNTFSLQLLNWTLCIFSFINWKLQDCKESDPKNVTSLMSANASGLQWWMTCGWWCNAGMEWPKRPPLQYLLHFPIIEVTSATCPMNILCWVRARSFPLHRLISIGISSCFLIASMSLYNHLSMGMAYIVCFSPYCANHPVFLSYWQGTCYSSLYPMFQVECLICP